MKWVLVRSDRYMVTIEHPNVVHLLGRTATLPLAQQLGTDSAATSSPACKYISRTQLAVVWVGESLYVVQIGKNPTFVGKDCDKVPSLTSAVSAADTEAILATVAKEKDTLLHFTAEPTRQGEAAAVGHHEVRVGVTAPQHVSAPPARSYHVPFEANVLHFPEELGLPVLAVRAESSEAVAAQLEGSTAANMSVPASVSLAVPSLAALEDEEEDEQVGPRSAVAQTETKAQWQGILDSALLNQQQRQQQQQAQPQPQPEGRSSTEAPAEKAKPAPAVVAAAPLPSTEVPFGAPTTTNSKTETAATAAAPPTAKRSRSPTATTTTTTKEAPADSHTTHAQHHQRIGFWEWMCHADGKADDPKSWRKYPLAVAQLLEEAYKAKEVTVRIPDALLFGSKGNAAADDKDKKSKSTYAVCFAEKSLNGGMIQYQQDDPTKFRVVRRKGGPDVDRRHVHAVQVIPSPSSSEGDDSDDDDDDDDDDSSSSSSYLSSSSSSSSEDRKKKTHKRRKTK